ncbi:MAG: transporter substrate-binding domain-containing protein [Gammaproteobacteria bacterium]|nr:transporter substrate-binding domain-containing protein [Gammaproteobacteria bacterium]
MLKQLRIVTVVTSLMASSWLLAAENLTVNLVGIENFRPYSYMQDNQAQGLYNDIVRELFDRAGYTVNIKLVPFKRMLNLTKKGQVTAMIGIFYTESRNKYALYLKDTQLTIIYKHLFVLDSSPMQNFSLTNLKNKTIARKRGFAQTPGYDELVKQGALHITYTEDINTLIKLLINKRVDAFEFGAFVASYYLKQTELATKIRKLSPAVAPGRSTYVAFSRRALNKLPVNFIEQINTVMLEMQADGTMQRLQDKAANLR